MRVSACIDLADDLAAGAVQIMGSNSLDGSEGPEPFVTVALLLILLGVFGVFATMPRSQLEAGSGTGNYGLPGIRTTSASGTGGTAATAPSGNTATIPSTTVDILLPTNDTAADLP